MANVTEQRGAGTRWEVAGQLVPAGLFVGMGIGWLFDHLVEGLFIGLGAGLLAMALVRLIR
jgi:F0F1-type ATP synthase assembly protein I